MNVLKMCFNWKVLAGLGAAGLGVFVVAPGLIGAAVPLLLALACPLSMVAMMIGMGRMGNSSQQALSPSGTYACPMHPSVRADQPGNCPTCGMALQPMEGGTVPVPASGKEHLAQLRAELRQISARQAALTWEVGRLEEDESPAPTNGETPGLAHTASRPQS